MPITPRDRPGVEIIQEFRETNVVLLQPALPACIVGPANQIVEAVDDTGAFVADSAINLPARLVAGWVSTPFEYANLGGASLGLEINNNIEAVMTFSGAGALTATEAAAEINSATAITGIVASVETSGTMQRLVLTTTASGDQSSIRVGSTTAAAILASLGYTSGYSVLGSTGYDNYLQLTPAVADYPDPRSNIDDLTIDYDTVRVFVNNGTGTAREALRTEAFLRGATSDVTIVDDGDGDSLSPYYDFDSADFTTSPAAAVVTGIVDITGIDYAASVTGRVLRMSVDGKPWQRVTLTATDGTELLAEINALWGTIATLDGGSQLVLTSTVATGGEESSIRLDKDVSDSTLTDALGLTGAGSGFLNTDVFWGAPYAPAVGDEVWADGVRVGLIVEIPVSPTNRLRLTEEKLLTWTASSWYIVAKNLDNQVATATRPGSELRVDDNTGTITVKPGLFRDSGGAVQAASNLLTYVAYNALRLDVTAAATKRFNMLRYGTTSGLANDIGPISIENPLALGMYFAIINAPGLETQGLGVDETNDATPEGTSDAYTRAFEFLESKEVYAIAPLTHDLLTAQIGEVHVTVMSEPENGLERILLYNPARPTRETPTLVASGIANVTGVPSSVVRTGIPNLQSLLAAQGVTDAVLTQDHGVYLSFSSDANKYLVSGVSGGDITINQSALVANDIFVDGGGSAIFDEAIVDRPFSLLVLGDELEGGTDEATAYGEIAQAFGNRRVVATAPDQAVTEIDGLETVVPGYYLNCALAGRIASKAPQQPLTNETVAGFTGLVGSNDRFGEPQFKIMCGGGLFVFEHLGTGLPAIRHQLTTDSSSLEKSELSITTALDFSAKFYRNGIRNLVGRFNISASLVDSVNFALSGLSTFLTDNNVLRSADIASVRQSVSAPDEVEAAIDTGVYFPCNKIRLRLVI